MAGTEIYLESFTGNKPSKSTEQFTELKKVPGEKNKKPFITNSGPEDAEGFQKNMIDPAAPEKKKENAFEPAKFSQGTEKTPQKKLNNSRRNKLMSEKVITTPKSEFDRLCEEVLGPEEVELGIEEPTDTENPSEVAEGEETGEAMSLAERLRSIVTDLEAVLAELEGTESEEAPVDTAEGEEEALDNTEDMTGEPAVREAVESEEIGTPVTGTMKQGKVDAVKGRANVVDGAASKVTKGPGDGKINKPGNGETEKAPDGVPALNGKQPNGNIVVKGKITGKNQTMFH